MSNVIDALATSGAAPTGTETGALTRPIPALLKQHVEFLPDTSRPTTIYKGIASPGTADATTSWSIEKTVLTYVSVLSSEKTAIDVTSATAVAWTNRASATYT